MQNAGVQKYGGNQTKPLLPIENRGGIHRSKAIQNLAIDATGQAEASARLYGGDQADGKHKKVHGEDHGGRGGIASKDAGDAASRRGQRKNQTSAAVGAARGADAH